MSTDKLKALSAVVSAWLEVWAMFKEAERDFVWLRRFGDTIGADT